MAVIKDQPTTLIEWRDQYIQYCKYTRHMRPATVTAKGLMLDGFIRRMYELGITTPGQLTNQIIEQWIGWLDEWCKNKNNSINTKIAHIKVFLEYIRDMDGDIHLKFIMIVRRKEDPIFRRAFTREEVNRALCFADRQEWLMIRMCFECGLRISELRWLELNNIDFSRKKIDFVGKGGKLGTVYFSDEVKLRLEDWIGRTSPKRYLWEGEALFQGAYQPMCVSQIRKRMKRVFERAGLQGFTPHSLRYSCATEASDLGAPTHTVQRILRHSNVSITEKYLCNQDRMTRQAFEDFRQNVPDEDLR